MADLVQEVSEMGEYLIDLLNLAVANKPIRDMAEAIGAFRQSIERLRASPLTTERREWLKAICRRSRETFIRRTGTKNGIAQYGADIDGAIVDDLLAALIAGPVSEGERA